VSQRRSSCSAQPTGRPGIRYWPVPPLGVFYSVEGDELRVLQMVDVRRLRAAL